MTDPEASPSESVESAGEPSGARIAATGCGILLVAVGGLVALVVWFVAELSGSASGAGPRAEGAGTDLRSWDDVEADGDVGERTGGRVTRTERRQLTAEREQVEQEFEFARNQLRSAFGAEAKQGWQQRIDELRAERDRLDRRLGR